MTLSCSYCDLPLPPSSAHADGPRYCCYGCSLAASITGGASGPSGHAAWTLARLGVAILLTMNVMAFSTLLYGRHVYSPDSPAILHVEAGTADLFRYLSLFFTIPVLLLLAGPIVANALRELRERRVNADLLIVLGVLAAFAYSYVSVVLNRDTLYFDTACMTLLLVTVGKYLEASARLRTTSALAELRSFLPSHATVIDDDSVRLVDVADLLPHSTVRVEPGQRLPVDGRILRGHAFIDEQFITGESNPVSRGPGDRVYAGSLNTDGRLFVSSLEPGHRSTLAHIINLLENARRAKGRFQRLADALSAWFVPIVVAVAIVAAAFHLHAGLDHALMTALAVLLISCPCALGLATPMAVSIALSRAARFGVYFRDVLALEALASVRDVFFDKTGTLTTGRPRLAHFTIDPNAQDSEHDTLKSVASIAHASNHHFCSGLAEFASRLGISPDSVSDVRNVPGRGVFARLPDGSPAALGSADFMCRLNCNFSPTLRRRLDESIHRGESVTCFGRNQRVHAVFSFDEELRSGARTALRHLDHLGVQARVLTGDHDIRARWLARELGVPVEGQLLPDQKLDRVRAASASRPTAMVGDGINDAPALAAATVGLALGCGADVARESASVCLMRDDPLDVAYALRLARHTVRIVRQNLFWCFLYNVVGVALAAAGLLTPVFAAVTMILSSLLVVANSLRLERLRFNACPASPLESPCSPPSH